MCHLKNYSSGSEKGSGKVVILLSKCEYLSELKTDNKTFLYKQEKSFQVALIYWGLKHSGCLLCDLHLVLDIWKWPFVSVASLLLFVTLILSLIQTVNVSKSLFLVRSWFRILKTWMFGKTFPEGGKFTIKHTKWICILYNLLKLETLNLSLIPLKTGLQYLKIFWF